MQLRVHVCVCVGGEGEHALCQQGRERERRGKKGKEKLTQRHRKVASLIDIREQARLP